MKDALIESFIKLHDKLCVTACLNEIKVLIGISFSCSFRENFGTHLRHTNTFVEIAIHRCTCK